MPAKRNRRVKGKVNKAKKPKKKPIAVKFQDFMRKSLGIKNPDMREVIRVSEEFYENLPDPMGYGSRELFLRESRRFHNLRVSSMRIISSALIPKYARFVKELVAANLLRKDSRVLSLGSGLGVLESFIAKELCSEGKVVGIDFAEELNKEARRISKQQNVKNVSFVAADIEKLPVSTGSQDLVVLTNPYMFPLSVYAEASRALKGRESHLIVMCNNDPVFSRALSRTLRSECGLKEEGRIVFNVPNLGRENLIFWFRKMR